MVNDNDSLTTSVASDVIPLATSRRFSTNVAFTLATRLLMLASSLGTSVVVARWLGAAGLGTLAVLNVTVALAVQVGCAGLPSANTYFISQDRSKLGVIWTNAVLFGLLAGAILVTLVLVLAQRYSSAIGNVPPQLITIAAISIPFQLLTMLGTNVFLSTGRIERFNQVEAATQLILLFNAAVVLILMGLGLASLVIFNTATAAVLSLIVVLLIHASIKGLEASKLKTDLRLFTRMMRYAIRFHISTVAALIIFRADLLLVNHFRGAKEAGAYAVASQMANLMVLLPAIIGTLLFPRVAASADPRGGMTTRVTRHTAFIMLVACITAVPFSFLLPFVYGAEFRDSTIQLLILLPGVYFFGIESVMVQHFSGTGLPPAIPMFWLIALVFNVTSNLLLIPSFGAIAAAITSTLSYTLIFVLVAFYFRSKTGNSLTGTLLLQRQEFQELFNPIRLALFSR